MRNEEDNDGAWGGDGPSGAGPIMDRHAPAVRSFLLRELRNPDWAEEATQESFARAIIGLARLREKGKFLSWVLGIASRVAMEMRRHGRRNAGVILERAAPNLALSEDERTSEAVRGLPEPYREAVWLRYWGQMTCEEVAAAQGVSVGTLTKRLTRAHALLREELKTGGESQEREVNDELRIVP